MNLISTTYGWSDDQILDCTMRRLTQVVAAIQRQQWLDDLAARRLETAKLRTLCTFIAASNPFLEGAENTMIAQAQRISLGAGTEPAGEVAQAAAGGTPERVRVGNTAGPGGEPTGQRGPTARVDLADLPDTPPGTVRAGHPAPIPDGIVPSDLRKLTRALS